MLHHYDEDDSKYINWGPWFLVYYFVLFVGSVSEINGTPYWLGQWYSTMLSRKNK